MLETLGIVSVIITAFVFGCLSTLKLISQKYNKKYGENKFKELLKETGI